MRKLIQFQNIIKEFDGQLVLKGINLDIYENEFVTLLGPSGCGKTTLLRILGGFLEPNQGRVIFDDKDITDLPAYKRDLNTVFQKYALFPHMNVYDNIAFGLRIKKEPEDIIAQKVARMLKLVGLEDYGKRGVNEMSGGQQQRVAIARALVNEPKVLLLDEPLGALDLKLRKEMQHELKKIQREVGITFIYVTHDQEEALTMSDKIVVMKAGEIQQIGTPTDIYNEPVNRYVANFIGESNIVDGIMLEDYKVMFEDKTFECVDAGFSKNENVEVVIRPEDLEIVAPRSGNLKGIVKSVLFKGVHYETIVETKSGTEITVKMNVSDDKPVVNELAEEMMSANDFYIDLDDLQEITDEFIIARADAQAWNPATEERISIHSVNYEAAPEYGTYPVTFSTQAGTSVTVNMIIEEENRVVNQEYEEEIFAVNFFKNADEIQESIALETDLKTWANASAWSLEDGSPVTITEVVYDFDPATVEPGVYNVTFKTEGYEYKVDTTKETKVGDAVGLKFTPDALHIMVKQNY
ncbi:spermidine/putrescine ABC transporter ATP-binding subunit [Lachnospiraceae bacterium YSD2013]|nr:ABC transporter ATP-binding protein [Lachnospiraceae bacterium]MBR5994558.1 ABC transporter ATP-binding protein [Lachnospiraceae bacterium]MCR4679658.1 ABC transporter ATP-binding protein [Lachnospiraceae bacterium]SCX00628.1 spermidine/putrescine ABC transporter ATP-binding subunit [Lachnospiraceae bacterium YSD2013]